MFQRIGLVTKPEKEEAIQIARKAEAFFASHGIETVFLQKDQARSKGIYLILTFGGDGTLLIGARIAVEQGIPLMGINLGTMGFLTAEEPEYLTECLEAILEEKYQIEERFLLNVCSQKNQREYIALNDAVITRGGFARLIKVQCSVNGEAYGIFTADGMIAATPTGSTGYSLSAGGPIIHPDMNCIVLTPVCAHSLQKCPCIVSGTSTIEFRLTEDRNQTAELQIDGMCQGKMEAGDRIIVSGSKKKIQLMRIHPYHFFTVVQNKLAEWGTR